MFTNRQLKAMIVPLFLEQLLVMLVGMADTIVVSYCGETAVSGVSLVNSFNTIFIFMFTALASGGAVVVSQYIGRKAYREASLSISQLLTISTVFSTAMMVLILAVGLVILRLLFGSIEPDVMQACQTYLQISAYSYPFLAIYNAGAALYRSLGRTKTTMYISAVANGVNIIGNLIGVFVLHAGVAGVAWPSLISRALSALWITWLCFKVHEGVAYNWRDILQFNGREIALQMKIALPNGAESGLFQLVKVGLSSIVALFGTWQIAANGIAQSIWSMAALINVAMGPVFITVIGQCMGAGDIQAANAYMKKLLKITTICAVVWNILVFAATPLVLNFYAISAQTRQMVIVMVLIHNIFCALVQPMSDPLGKGLRAAGDITFATMNSIVASTGMRLLLSWLLALKMGMGVLGITWAMVLSWTFCGVLFFIRWKSGKWQNFNVLGPSRTKSVSSSDRLPEAA